jgi:hypothetical protein
VSFATLSVGATVVVDITVVCACVCICLCSHIMDFKPSFGSHILVAFSCTNFEIDAENTRRSFLWLWNKVL